MMKMLLGGNETTRKIDSYAINELRIPSIVLMENAAISFTRHIGKNNYFQKKKKLRFFVLVMKI